jgi:hypothetical protein
MSAGALPSGVNLQSGGSLSGTTTATGTYSLTLQVSDSSSPQQTASRTFTLNVNTAMTGPKISLSFFGADYNAKANWPPIDGNGQAATLGGIRLWDDNVKWAHIESSCGRQEHGRALHDRRYATVGDDRRASRNVPQLERL